MFPSNSSPHLLHNQQPHRKPRQNHVQWHPLNPNSPPSSTFHFLAGLTIGILSASLLQPADLLKTRVQQSPSTSLRHTFHSITSGPTPLRQLWRGTLPSVIRTGLGSALYFSSLNALRQRVARSHLHLPAPFIPAEENQPSTRPNPLSPASSASSSSLPRLSNLANLLTGAVARASAGLCLMPITIIKVRYESSLYNYPSLLRAATSILRTEGPRGFFAGSGATIVRDAPYAGLYILFYEQSKKQLGALHHSSSSPPETRPNLLPPPLPQPQPHPRPQTPTSVSAPINFTSGIIAAALATAITNPFDAVKTRLQLMPDRYGNMVQAAVRMVREAGVRSLFAGLGLRVGRKAVSAALAWTVYEELVRRAERTVGW